MVAMNKYSITYAKSLVGATPSSQLIDQSKPKRVNGLTDDQIALMEEESAKLDREFRLIEQSYGADHLDLVVVAGFLERLLGNARIVRYFTQNYLLNFKKSRTADSRPRENFLPRGPGPESAGTAGDAVARDGSSAAVGMTANPFGAHLWPVKYGL